MGKLPDTNAYALRPAVPGDLGFIHALRVAGLRAHVERLWGWDAHEQRERFGRRFDPGAYRVIVVDGQDVGAVSVDWGGDVVFLSDIEIAAEWRGRGLGTAVLNDLLAEARRRNQAVQLQVLQGNPARDWYERLGFEAVGETATHVLMRAGPTGGGSG
jgi:ribosomal protein S18 acetylase RimI-like enzyme